MGDPNAERTKTFGFRQAAKGQAFVSFLTDQFNCTADAFQLEQDGKRVTVELGQSDPERLAAIVKKFGGYEPAANL